jgi:hypothetical protein
VTWRDVTCVGTRRWVPAGYLKLSRFVYISWIRIWVFVVHSDWLEIFHTFVNFLLQYDLHPLCKYELKHLELYFWKWRSLGCYASHVPADHGCLLWGFLSVVSKFKLSTANMFVAQVSLSYQLSGNSQPLVAERVNFHPTSGLLILITVELLDVLVMLWSLHVANYLNKFL